MCFDFELSDGSTTLSPTAAPTHAASTTTSGRKKKSKAPRGAITPKLPKFANFEEKADFMINVFKVKLCTRRRRHTWSGCPYAHLGETAKRRDPKTHHAVPCPEMKQGNRCPRGDRCPYSHHDFEYWLHPARYCTVMCNKGPNCDRSLCFFAHHENELRSCTAATPCNHTDCPTTTTTVAEERITDQQVDIHESSSSGEINLEQCVDEMKSSASLTSIADSFRSTYDRFQENAVMRDKIQVNSEAVNDYPPSLFLNNNMTNIDMQSIESFSAKPPGMATASSISSLASDFCPSSDICHLLSQPRGAAVHNNHQLPSELRTQYLRKSLSTGQTQHLSPTCHFSGVSGEFMTPNGIQTLPSCPPRFDLFDANADQNARHRQSTMPISNSTMIAQPFTSQHDLLHPYAQLTGHAPSTGNCRGLDQAMDSLPTTLNQDKLLAQTTALQNTASPFQMLTPSSGGQSLLHNVELLQLLKLQLLHNSQVGGMVMSPSPPQPPSLLNPTYPPQGLGTQGLIRDQLYSLQHAGQMTSFMQGNGFFP